MKEGEGDINWMSVDKVQINLPQQGKVEYREQRIVLYRSVLSVLATHPMPHYTVHSPPLFTVKLGESSPIFFVIFCLFYDWKHHF